MVLIGGLCRLLISGDPVLPTDSKAFLQVRRWRTQAEFNISKHNYDQAYRDLNECLQHIGRTLPISRTEVFLSTLWQIVRQISHKLWLGKWLSQTGRFFANKSERQQAEISSMEISMVYQHMFCLCLSKESKDATLFLALSAVNYAELAGSSMPKSMLAEIYVNAALCFKQSLFPFIHKSYLSKARRILSSSTVPAKLKWLTTDEGFKFLVSHKWQYGEDKSSEFTTQFSRGDPLSYGARAYRQHLIGQCLRLLTGTAGDSHASAILQHATNIIDSASVPVSYPTTDKIEVTRKLCTKDFICKEKYTIIIIVK